MAEMFNNNFKNLMSDFSAREKIKDFNTNKKKSQISFSKFLSKFDELLENEDNFDIPRKSLEKSTEYRQAGNVLYGSKNHDQSIHAKILSLYTKSIAFAVENSEELALGYGNRSALLMHLKKYKECLVDIERACQITQSDELKKKLLARKGNCLLHLNNVNKVDEKSPVIKFKPSEEIPCASELVTIKYNKKYGRHVVATKDIQPGTVIVVEKGLVIFPNMESLHLNCSHCLSVAWNGIPCQSCTTAVYCSEECKTKAWQQYHDIECSILPYFVFLNNFGVCTKSLVLAVRLYIKLIKSEGLANIIREAYDYDEDQDKDKHLNRFFHNKLFQCDRFQAIYNLSENDQYSLENHVLCKKVIKLLFKKSKFFHETDESIEFKQIDQTTLFYCVLKVFQKLRNIIGNNGYKFQTSTEKINLEGSDFGVIISSFCSLFNHSCISNVKRLFTKNQEIVLFTSTFVCKGQQLFVNYGTDDSMTKKERQDFLKHYSVVCDCQACKEDWLFFDSAQQGFDKENAMKVFFEFEITHVLETFHLIFGDPNKWSFSEDILKDVANIMNIFCKYYSGLQVYGLTNIFREYIIDYYENFYAMKNDIPSSC